MILEIPFFRQTTKLNCGPAALRMILAYFGRDEEIETLEEKTGIKEGKGTSTLQIASAAASSGFRAKLYSKHVSFNEENLKHDFYQKYVDQDLREKFNELVSDVKERGVEIEEKRLSLEEVISLIKKDSVPIVLLDWNVVKGREENGYHGHFVPVVGYDERNVYVHNHGLTDPKEFMPIPRDIFDRARKADGTDEDILVVYRT